MDRSVNLVGDFLRAARERVTPAQAGIPSGVGVRRTPGLRREEVAMLAGISVDYYLRLEKGRDVRPSAQVLTALARVLRLDGVETAHLMALTREAPRATATASAEDVPAGTLNLLTSLGQPAFVEDRYFEVVAANDLARALSPVLVPGGNQLVETFLDSAERALHTQWRDVTECMAANLRHAVGADVDDPRFVRLVDRLWRGSARFRELWARQEVRGQSSGRLVLRHPEVGELTLNRDRLAISGTRELMLVVYHPDAGSLDAEKLARLTASAGGLAGPRLSGDLVGGGRRF